MSATELPTAPPGNLRERARTLGKMLDTRYAPPPDEIRSPLTIFKVDSLHATDGVVNITEDNGVTVLPVRHLGSYEPVAGDPVMVYKNGADWLVLGSVKRGQIIPEQRDFIANPITKDELSVQVGGANLLNDSSFESTNNLADWPARGIATITRSTDKSRSGTHSLKFVGTGSTSSPYTASSHIPVQPGQSYVASAYGMRSSTTAAMASSFRAVADSWGTGSPVETAGPIPEWGMGSPVEIGQVAHQYFKAVGGTVYVVGGAIEQPTDRFGGSAAGVNIQAVGGGSGAAGGGVEVPKNHLLDIRFYDAAGTQISRTGYKEVTCSEDGWTRIVQYGVAPAGAVSARVWLVTEALSSTKVMFWDDIQFEAGDVVTAYGPKGSEVLPGTITAEQLANLAVTADKVAANAISVTKIVDGAVERTKIAMAAINADLIDMGAVTTTKISDLAITTPKIATNSIVTDHLNGRIVQATNIVGGTITAFEIATRTITADRIATGTITANEILAGTITAAEMATGTITALSGIIADAAIGTAKIANLAVTDAKIASLAVTNAKIGDLAVSTAKIANLAVGTAKIADLAVSTAKIADLAVTNAKIDSLSANKITAGTITASISINSPTISGGTITGGTIQTATTGTRVVLTSSQTDRVRFYSGTTLVSDIGWYASNLTLEVYSGAVRVIGGTTGLFGAIGEVYLTSDTGSATITTTAGGTLMLDGPGGTAIHMRGRGTTPHSQWIAWYRQGDTATRSGYFGFTSSTSHNIVLNNQAGGQFHVVAPTLIEGNFSVVTGYSKNAVVKDPGSEYSYRFAAVEFDNPGTFGKLFSDIIVGSNRETRIPIPKHFTRLGVSPTVFASLQTEPSSANPAITPWAFVSGWNTATPEIVVRGPAGTYNVILMFIRTDVIEWEHQFLDNTDYVSEPEEMEPPDPPPSPPAT